MRVLREEEEPTIDRLNREVGYLFPPNGVTPELEVMLEKIDFKYGMKKLREMCKAAGISPNGHKKKLAAKLIAQGLLKLNDVEVDKMEEEKVDLSKQREWEGKPGALKVPEAYIKDLHFEIVVFARKERGGSDFTFRCKEYERIAEGEYRFGGVVIDTSKRNPQGDVELARLTYHPEIVLVDTPFMVVPASESEEV